MHSPHQSLACTEEINLWGDRSTLPLRNNLGAVGHRDMCCQWGLSIVLCERHPQESGSCGHRAVKGTEAGVVLLRVSATSPLRNNLGAVGHRDMCCTCVTTSPLRNNPGVVAHRDMCCQWGLRLGADLVTCVSNVTSQEQSGSCSPSGYVLSMGTEAGVVLT
ncbi:hypothetical protein J6590_000237 [Homalodisca vitripennis]|nr:hypothetical protein J6590_000237 [Homalodisca vitripennis]